MQGRETRLKVRSSLVVVPHLEDFNHADNIGKQMSFSMGFYDDWDAAKIADKEQGNTFELLEQRFSTFANNMKQFFISTPETRPSNIENLYLMGDQRKWMLPCPLCGEYIEIKWTEKHPKVIE